MPANFRTYEAQSRLLTAVIAAHPGLKLNFKEISRHYGSDWTESGIEHYFRPIKKNAKAVQQMVDRNEDPATFNHNMYFGDSTPDGIQFQFRQIKRDAESLRQGKEITPSAASSSSTPAKTPRTPKTPGSRIKRTASAAAISSSLSKSSTNKKLKRELSDEETLAALNADDLDMLANAGTVSTMAEQTPTKPRFQNPQNQQQQRHEPPPALDLTGATSPEDNNDDTLTPREDPAVFSFVQTNNSQPSALGSADPWSTYNNGTHGAAGGGGQHYYSSFGKDDFEDDGEV